MVPASLLLNDNGRIYNSEQVVNICKNTEVKIYSNDQLNNVKYWFNYEGDSIPNPNWKGGGLPANSKYRFTTAGSFLLIQQGELRGQKSYACKVVKVWDAPTPNVSTSTCQPKNMTMLFPKDQYNIYDKFEIRWGDNQVSTMSRPDSIISHNYPANRNYTMLVIGRWDAMPSCSSGTTVSVTPNGIPPYVQLPVFNRLEMSEDGKSLNLTATTYNSLETNILQREVGTSSYINLNQKIANGTAKVNNIRGLDAAKQYCYKLQIEDLCKNKVTTAEYCTVNLEVKTENEKNVLNWTPYPLGFSRFEVLGNASILATYLNRNQSTYTQNNIVCGQQYCYQVKAVTGNIELLSQRKCVTGQNIMQLPPIVDGLVSIDQNTVKLSWSLPDGFQSGAISIDKAEGLSGTFSTIKTVGQNDYSEPFQEKGGTPPPCFSLSYADLCNNKAPFSDPLCPVILHAKNNELSWNNYEKFISPSYSLEIFDSQGNYLKDLDINGIQHFKPDPDQFSLGSLRFRIKTKAGNGMISYSNILPFSFHMTLMVPEVFTPNGDGFCDTFKVFTKFVGSYQYQIFDRWGNIVFVSKLPDEEWDGRINGMSPQAGAYIYTITYADQNGREYKKDGVVQIVLN